MVLCTWTSALSPLWKRRRNGSGSTKVTVRMGLHVFLSAVRMGLWYCTDGSSWPPVQVGIHSACIRATFVIQYVGTLSKVGNTHSFRYCGIKVRHVHVWSVKNKFRNKFQCGCHWLQNYRPYRKKTAVFNFKGLLVIYIPNTTQMFSSVIKTWILVLKSEIRCVSKIYPHIWVGKFWSHAFSV